MADSNPYQSPNIPADSGDKKARWLEIKKESYPFWYAWGFFLVTTAINGTLLIMAYQVGFEAGVGDEGMNTPGWKYLNLMPLVDFPTYFAISILTGGWLFDAFIEVENIQTAFVFGRIFWPAFGYFVGWIAKQSYTPQDTIHRK